MRKNPRKMRRRKTDDQRAYEQAACDILYALDGRRHPVTYPTGELQRMVVADLLTPGLHENSPPHLWWMVRSIGVVAKRTGTDPETVTADLFHQAETVTPGATL